MQSSCRGVDLLDIKKTVFMVELAVRIRLFYDMTWLPV